MPFVPPIFVLSHQFLFFGVNRNHGLIFLQEFPRFGFNMSKLLVSIRILVAFQRFLVALKAVSHFMEQMIYGAFTYLMSHII